MTLRSRLSISVFFISMSSSAVVFAGNTCSNVLGSGISTDWVHSQIEDDDSLPLATKIIRQAAQNEGVLPISRNRAILNKHNENYTSQLLQGNPSDQFSSCRCWIFAFANIVRSLLIAQKKVGPDFEFSQNYLYFFNMLEKSNTFLEDSIKRGTKTKSMKAFLLRQSSDLSNLGDGGFAEYFTFLVDKYGLIPKTAMRETVSSKATTTLQRDLKDLLASAAQEMSELIGSAREDGRDTKTVEFQNQLRVRKLAVMQNVWAILATHLGTPPQQFEFRRATLKKTAGKTPESTSRIYTPIQFARNFVKFHFEDYVTVMNDPFRKRDKTFVYKNSSIGRGLGADEFNVKFLNLTPRKMEDLVMSSIDGGIPVYFGGDISKGYDATTRILHPDIFSHEGLYNTDVTTLIRPLNIKEQRFMGLSASSHAMAIIAYDRPDKNELPIKFLDENSWGKSSANVYSPKAAGAGNLHLYREWFEKYVFKITIHKRFLYPAAAQAWSEKPVVIVPLK